MQIPSLPRSAHSGVFRVVVLKSIEHWDHFEQLELVENAQEFSMDSLWPFFAEFHANA
jgi:predicted SnoaL-like aldol condensation-catalyzing enzyme